LAPPESADLDGETGYVPLTGRAAEECNLQRSIVLLSLLVALPLFACNPQGNAPPGKGEGKVSLRVCKDDFRKLCPNLTGKERRRCLQQNLDKASADCRSAFEARRAARRKRKDSEGD
jgi:hypothetical protein